MKNHILIVAALLVSIVGLSQNKNQELSVLLEQAAADNEIAGIAAGYSTNGTTIAQAAAGWADLETKEKITLDTKLRMASIAKPMTALAIMQLVEKKVIDLDASVQTYIPNYPLHSKTQITIRHLLSHTSGLTGYIHGKESSTTVEYTTLGAALTIFKDRDLLFEPGTRYSYSTYGYTLLGAVIEKVTGGTFEAYMQQNIWDKAGMTNTGVDKYGIQVTNQSQLYHRKNGKKKAKIAKENNLSNRIPGGGFYTTVGDMLKFGNAVLDNTFVTESTFALMREHHSLEKVSNGYGFGWFLYGQQPEEGSVIGHSGGQTGCTSFLFIAPNKKAVSIVLANTSRAGSIVDPLAVRLLNLAREY